MGYSAFNAKSVPAPQRCLAMAIIWGGDDDDDDDDFVLLPGGAMVVADIFLW